MSYLKFYIITDTTITLVMPDGSEQTMILEAPTAKDSPYEMDVQQVNVQEDFDDTAFNRQKGYKKFRFVFRYRYDYHRMDLIALLAAETVKLKVPVYLWDDDRYYQEFNCKLLNENFIRKAQNGIYAQGSGQLNNKVPNGDQVLEFMSETYDLAEYLDVINYLHPFTVVTNDSEEIPGFIITAETDDGKGLVIEEVSPALYGSEQTRTIEVGNQSFNFDTLILESNE